MISLLTSTFEYVSHLVVTLGSRVCNTKNTTQLEDNRAYRKYNDQEQGRQ